MWGFFVVEGRGLAPAQAARPEPQALTGTQRRVRFSALSGDATCTYQRMSNDWWFREKQKSLHSKGLFV
jgi:hypothetical protein